jgi:hypothetical protein
MLSAYGLAVNLQLPVPELAGLDQPDPPGAPLTVGLAQLGELEQRWSGHHTPEVHARAVVDGETWIVEQGQAGDLRMSHPLAQLHLDETGATLGCAPADADDPAWRRLLLDTGLVTASLARGFEALHASAVVHHGRAVAVAGPAGAGKTTLMAELLGRGALLLADDVVALGRVAGPVILAQPAPPLANLPDGVHVEGIGRVVHRFDGESWVRVDRYVRVPIGLSLVVVLDRAGDAPDPRLETAQQPATLLLAHALHSGSPPARRGARFEILADLAASAEVATLTARPDVPARELADLIEARLAIARAPSSEC